MEKYMKIALKEAKKAYIKKEVPIGACIVYNDKVIAKAHNLRESKNISTNHAEIIAINKACKKLGTWKLEDCILYVTLEPCIMCSGAIIQSRIKKVVFGAKDPRFGAAGSYLDVFKYKFNHEVEVIGSFMEDECSKLIKDFFNELRNGN